MWLALVLFLIMCGVIFFQAIQGAFSALIMAILCVLSGTAALGLHEAVAQDLLAGMLGDYAYPVAFAGLFVVPLAVLRILLDKFIPRNPLVPAPLDKTGALLCACIAGFITVGVMGIAIQMIPFGPNILGFERYDQGGKPKNSLWLNPDKFTVSLCGHLANSSLRSSEFSWHRDHPDFLTELHWFRNTDAIGSRISVDPNSVRATGLYVTPSLFKYTPPSSGRESGAAQELPGPPPGQRWLVVGVQLSTGAEDSDGTYRFSPTQVRLVGEDGAGRSVQFGLRGVGPFDGQYFSADSVPLWGDRRGKFDFVFEVPEDFKCRFVEFKRAGRAVVDPKLASGETRLEVPRPRRSPAAPPSPPSPATAAPAPRPAAGAARTVPVRPEKRDSHFGNRLPMTLRRYAGAYVQLGDDGHSLRSGQLTAEVDNQGDNGDASGGSGGGADADQPYLETFAVTPGLHMLQLNVEAVHATTTLASVVNLTRRALQQYRIIDRQGEHYWPAGLIAECDSADGRLMEVQFFPEGVEYRSQIKALQRIRFEELKGDYRFVLLFVLPPGTAITQFDPGGNPVDISNMNLVAPS